MGALRVASLMNVLGAVGLTAVLAVLGACANLQGTGTPISTSSPTMDPIQLAIWQLQGDATLQQATQVEDVAEGAQIMTGQPLQIGQDSSARLRMGGDALLELGSEARLIALSLPGHENSGLRSGFRLEQGYLRLVLAKQDRVTELPVEVSLGRWVAQIEAGEYFFDARDQRASVCVSVGSLKLSGAKPSKATASANTCLNLIPDMSPRKHAMTESGWALLRTGQQVAQAIEHSNQERVEVDMAALRRQTQDAQSSARSSPAPPPAPSATWSDKTTTAAQSAVTPRPVHSQDFHLRLPESEIPLQVVGPQAPVFVTTSPAESPSPSGNSTGEFVSEPTTSVDSSPPPQAIATASPAAVEFARMPDIDAGAQVDASSVRLAQADSQNSPPRSAPTTSAPVTASVASLSTPVPQSVNPPVQAAPAFDGFVEPAPEVILPGEWIVNVSSHSNLDVAQERVEKLESAGFIAAVRSEIVRGLNSYRVVIQGIESEEVADSVVSDLQSKHGLQSAWAFRVR